MTTHALMSPSGAHRWVKCPASVALCENIPDAPSVYADEGTRAHELAAALLTHRTLDAPTDPEMLGHVSKYVELVNAHPGILLVEQSFSIEHLTGEKDAKGTPDAVVLGDNHLDIFDLKYGMGVVVDAEKNEQLMLYALAVLYAHPFLDIDHVRLHIFQPRINHYSRWDTSSIYLRGLALNIKIAAGCANTARIEFKATGKVAEDLFSVGDSQCRFCRAKANCPAIARAVAAELTGEPEPTKLPASEEEFKTLADGRLRALSNPEIGQLMNSVEWVESWCKAVRAKVASELAEGNEIPGWKLVQGKQGNRQWSSPDEAERVLKSMRLKDADMYDFSLISPTTAEKRAKAKVIGPRQWTTLQKLITRAEGKPSVAPASDPRPAISIAATAAEFNDER